MSIEHFSPLEPGIEPATECGEEKNTVHYESRACRANGALPHDSGQQCLSAEADVEDSRSECRNQNEMELMKKENFDFANPFASANGANGLCIRRALR